MIDFRCPRCNAKLADIDEACPRVQVKCPRCLVVRVYTPRGSPRHWDYARTPEGVSR